MAQRFPSIDYEDLICDITDDIGEGYLKDEDTVYIVRQAEAIFAENVSREVNPVIDYFYSSPALEESLKTMTVREARRYCREAVERAGDNEGIKAVAETLVSDLVDYTKGNPKRNDRSCSMLMTKEELFPMMVYFDDCVPSDKIEEIKAADLLAELRECSAES